MVVGMLSIIGFNFADTYFVAQLGTAELAAMAFTFPVVLLVGSIALGMGIGTASVLSRAIGKGDMQEVRRLATDSLLLALLVVAVFAAVGLVTIDPLFRLLGATETTLPRIRQYMTVWYVGMVFVVVPMVGNSAIRATGDTVTPSLIMLAAGAMNVVLDPLLIFGLAGLPRLELTGAALATVLTRATTMVLSLVVLHFRKRMLDASLPRLRRVWDSWKRVLYVGVPAAAARLLVPLSTGILTRMISRFGPPAVAAVGAGTRVEALALLVVFALQAALVPFVGQNWGAGRFDRVQRAERGSNRFALWWGALCAIALLPAALPIARVFRKEAEVTTYIARYLWIVSVGLGPHGMCVIAGAFFSAINRPLLAAAVNFIRVFVLYIPLAYAGSLLLGATGLFAGVSLANVLAGIVSLLWIKHVCKGHGGRSPGDAGGRPRNDSPEPGV
jgi:putative MATE family efflux protein